MKSIGVRFLMVVVAALLVVTLTQAQVVKKAQGSLDDLKTVSSRMRVPAELAPVNDMRAAESQGTITPLLRDLYSGWDRFQTENGTGWWMTVDKRTGKPALISGSGIPWVPGKGNSISESAQVVTTDSVVNLARQFVNRYPELFGVDNSDLEVVPEGTGEFGGYLWYVNLQRTFHGIPVEKSYVVFRVNNGNLIQFGGEYLGDINLDPLPTINVETAQQILESFVGGFQPGDNWADAPRISVIPFAPQGDIGMYKGQVGKGVEYRLVYTLAFHRPDVMGTWTAKIDAHTGEILAFADANVYGSIKGGVYIVSNLDTEKVVPFPYANTASSTYANAAGVYSTASGTVTCTMSGKYVSITDSCGAISLSATAPADMTFGTSSGTDCTTPGTGGAGNTHASRTNYYHLTLWKEKAQAWLPSNSWLTGKVTSKVNLSQTCNAYWDGSAVNFFKSGGGCSNTGELPTVFLHEIGHGLDSNDGSPSSTVGSSETYGDTNGILMTHNSCLGVNFIPGQNCSGYGNACSSCTGIREADYTKHSTTTPCKPSMLSGSSGYHCSTDSSYPGPCGYEGHCESVVGSEALYTLAANTTYGLMSKSGQDSNTAWFLADRMFFLTRPTATDTYTCSTPATASGCGTSNWFMVYLAVDDDDGNLTNGTPHGAEIYKAFNAHAIACSTYSSIVDYSNTTTCPISTTTAPTVSGSAGSGSVSLSWTSIASATGYVVLRNELGATNGMTILATTTSTSYTDTMVATGVTYYYAVVAYNGTVTSTGSGDCLGKVGMGNSLGYTPTTGTTYSISGTVSGAVTSGVTVNLTGAATQSATTATGGTYTFSGLSNGSYTVTPSYTGYTFSPTSTAVTVSSANQTGINFTSTANPTYSISGTVSGAIAAGVTVKLTGAATATTTTATGGTYTFSGLANGSYTVTPTLTGYTFSPTSTAVTIASANQTAINFTSTAAATYSISGTVSGAIAAGVTMNLTGAATASTTTATGGTYTFSGLANGSYTVTPSFSGYTFSPTSTAVTIASANQTAINFTSTAVATYSISGTVSGAVTSGVAMALTGTATANTTTGTGGTYTFSGLANGSYTVTPSLSGYSFSPVNIAVTISSANQTGKNFTSSASGGCSAQTAAYNATYKCPTCTTAGTSCAAAASLLQCTGASGEPNAPNTIDSFADGTSGTCHSDESIEAITITSASGCMAPGASVTVTVTAYCYSTADYLTLFYSTSTSTPTWTKEGSTQVATGAGSKTFTWTFTLGGTVGTMQAVRAQITYNADPGTSAVYAGSYNDRDDLAFALSGTAPTTYSISGTVSGATASGVTINLTGAATANTTTDASGNYTFASLANGSYTVTPSKSGYTFSPVNIAVTISGANQTGKNFTATAATTYSISGTVSGAVASGVTVACTGQANTTTDASGNYTFAGLAAGSYTVTPSLSGYTFSPVNIAVTITTASQTGKNFTSTASGGDIALTSGVGVSTGALALHAYKYYTIVVPTNATNLAITLTGLTADIDLYANNSLTHPTTSSYGYSSTNGGTTAESISVASPTVATWSIGVYAYAAGSATVTATVTTGTGGTTILTDGLESGWTSAVVTTVTGTAAAFSFVTTGTYPTISAPHGGTYMAQFNSYNAGSGNTARFKRTATFAMGSSYTTYTLKFWMYHDTGYSSNADKVQVQVSTDGSTWTSVGTAVNRYTGATGWAQASVDISAYKGQTVYFGFLGTSAYGDNCYLDDVTVVGQ